MDKCCLNCKNYVTDYGYWFCRKENDDEQTNPLSYCCQDYKPDDDMCYNGTEGSENNGLQLQVQQKQTRL